MPGLDLFAGFPKYRDMRHRLFSLPLLLNLVVAAPAVGAEAGSEAPTCSDSAIVASAVRTEEDIRVFVQCAYELVQEVGTEAASRAFHEEERWRSGSIYVVVVELSPAPGAARLWVFPPDPSREGIPQGHLIDNFGSDLALEGDRVVSQFGEGWSYYSFANPATGREEPKASYFKAIDWNGVPSRIGAGIYRRDIPGTCHGDEVNAAMLDADPSQARLQEFVRCAAMDLESRGYFATFALSFDPRWRSGSVYLFGLDTYGNALFTGDPYSQPYGPGISELDPSFVGTFGERDVLSVANAFGETFLYYTTRNPLTGLQARKVTFVKRVMIFGVPVLLAAGYYPEDLDHEDNGDSGFPPGDGQVAGQGGSATLLYAQAPTILNPYLSRGTKDAEAASLVIEPLAEYTPDGEIVPVLATRVPTIENGGFSADRTSITWTIREDALWSDGTPVTASDVVFTWRYCTAPGGGCARSRSFENVASVEVVDERTVTITFVEPTSFPYDPFVSSVSPILQAAQFADCLGEAAAGCTDENLGPIGTGPLSRVRLRRRQHHPLPVQSPLPGRRVGSSLFR